MKIIISRLPVFLLLLLSTLLWAGETGEEQQDRHSSDVKPHHLCFGVGAHVGIYRAGIHTRLWIDDVLGFNIKGSGNYWQLDGYSVSAEVMWKPRIGTFVRPYLNLGYGMHRKNYEETLNGIDREERLLMSTVRAALGAAIRLGEKDRHEISLEGGYIYGQTDLHSSTLIGHDGVNHDEYVLEPITVQVLYTYFFCEPDQDTDKDGIQDQNDNCPELAEDMDGFADKDGCPDYDNDADDIADSVDQCPDVPEDRDGFEDMDGCPEFDNDNDSIHDTLDQCPNLPEDYDGHLDEDGCPDEDNDGDGIVDSLDGCPDEAEDMDGVDDHDGCPDYDDDEDGVPDTLDQCLTEKETLNGFEDGDGCPDERPVAVEIVREPLVLKGVTFETNKAVLRSSSFVSLDTMVSSLLAWQEINVEIQGHTDNIGTNEDNLALSIERANSVKEYLVGKGVDESRITIIGRGEEEPLETNDTEEGRAQNRRVVIRRVD